MVEGIPAFFAASRFGFGLIVAMSVVFAASTIATYVVLSVYSASGLQRLKLGPLERYGEVISTVARGVGGARRPPIARTSFTYKADQRPNAVAEIVQPMRDLPSTEVGGQHGFDGTFGARRRKRNRVVKLSTTLTIHKKLCGNLCGMAPICASLAHRAIK
jgi:hypothetical protein